MKCPIRIAALIASLFLVAAGFEVLAQSTNSMNEQQAQNQQNEMYKYAVKDQAQVMGSAQQNGKKNGAAKGKKAGPGDGTGNNHEKPKDGTGYGSNSGKKTGPQDGTGPQHDSGRNSSGKGRRGGPN